MRIYCMSDIHGRLSAFEEALSLVAEHLEEPETMLILLGDYIHGGSDNYGVLDTIMALQSRFGTEKVLALMGNHEEFVLMGDSSINYLIKSLDKKYSDEAEDKYIRWMEKLPRYYAAEKTIFVHAGIDEGAGDLWEWCTGDEVFTGKYPAEIGKIKGLDMKVVAGHVGTSQISGDPHYHGVYHDGANHYYIDGTVLESGEILVLMVDTETDKYYRVTETGNWLILPYDKEN